MAEQRGAWDAGYAVRPVRERDPVHRYQIEDLLEADGDHRQIVAAQAQRGQPENAAGDRCDADAHAERNPERQAVTDGAERDAVGTESEERRLRQVDLSGVA